MEELTISKERKDEGSFVVAGRDTARVEGNGLIGGLGLLEALEFELLHNLHVDNGLGTMERIIVSELFNSGEELDSK